MKVVFFSNFYPRCKRDYYLYRSKAGLASAADAHQYAIAQGLNSCCDNFEIINLPSVCHYPLRYKDISQQTEKIEENGLTIHNIGYCNFIFSLFLSRYKNAKKALREIVYTEKDITYIVVYATNLAFLRAATEIRREYSNVRICLVIPDLPSEMASSKLRSIKNFISRLFFKSYDDYISQFDSYVLLTESMKEKIGCKDNKYIVNEGIYDEEDSSRSISYLPNERFTIFYSGMLYRKFGVMNLVEAVHQIQSDNVHLIMCGYGESKDEIIKMSETDQRIQYIGIISREEALKYQSQADLLVNPRIPDNNPFTRYSFPSKNLEFLASGTPTLLYQLEGIPNEYYDYCYYLDKDHTDVESLKYKIEEIMCIPYEDRKRKAIIARDFILKNKNSEKAGKAISELLKSTI